MTEQTPADAYIESCLIDLSKQLTAAQKRIGQLEKGFRDLLIFDTLGIPEKAIVKACLLGAIDENGLYCFVPDSALEKKANG